MDALPPIIDLNDRIPLRQMTGEATSVVQWLEKGSVRKSLERLPIGVLLQMARSMGVSIPAEYNHRARRWRKPSVEMAAERVWRHLRSLDEAREAAERAARAAAADAIAAQAAAAAAAEQPDETNTDTSSSSSSSSSNSSSDGEGFMQNGGKGNNA